MPREDAEQTGAPKIIIPPCIYPGSHSTARNIYVELAGIAANGVNCPSIYLGSFGDFSSGGENHFQGIARSQKLSDGSIYFFLVRSDLNSGALGDVMQYRYTGPTDGEHLLKISPPAFVPLQQLIFSFDQHPSDIAFLPDVNELDAGYLFVIEEYDTHRLTAYRWKAEQDLVVLGQLFAGFPAVPSSSAQGGPQFVFLDLVADYYYLAVASQHWGFGQLFRAAPNELFPNCTEGSLTLDAFKPHGMFPFPVLGGPAQTKLVRDGDGNWFLLSFRSDPNDDPNGTDYVDVFGVRFDPFVISSKLETVHIFFPAGDTGFANSGTHYVEKSGRLLISSSYRWSEPLKPGDPAAGIPPSDFVCRVDELASW
jgi:hypothetical protein